MSLQLCGRVNVDIYLLQKPGYQESSPTIYYPSSPFILKLLGLEVRTPFTGQVPLLFSPLFSPPTYPHPLKMIIYTSNTLWFIKDIHIHHLLAPGPYPVSQVGMITPI